MSLEIRPVTRERAREFVAEHHRHAPKTNMFFLFCLGVYEGEDLVGVGIAARPAARGADDGLTVDVQRCCILEAKPNAASMIYGALLRAAKAIGYRKAITYTLEDETGVSPLAAGFKAVTLSGRPNWHKGGRTSHQVDIFGNRTVNESRKRRWERDL